MTEALGTAPERIRNTEVDFNEFITFVKGDLAQREVSLGLEASDYKGYHRPEIAVGYAQAYGELTERLYELSLRQEGESDDKYNSRLNAWNKKAQAGLFTDFDSLSAKTNKGSDSSVYGAVSVLTFNFLLKNSLPREMRREIDLRQLVAPAYVDANFSTDIVWRMENELHTIHLIQLKTGKKDSIPQVYSVDNGLPEDLRGTTRFDVGSLDKMNKYKEKLLSDKKGGVDPHLYVVVTPPFDDPGINNVFGIPAAGRREMLDSFATMGREVGLLPNTE